jgi:hypothetical protein
LGWFGLVWFFEIVSHCVAQTFSQVLSPPASTSPVLGSQACVTTPAGHKKFFVFFLRSGDGNKVLRAC